LYQVKVAERYHRPRSCRPSTHIKMVATIRLRKSLDDRKLRIEPVSYDPSLSRREAVALGETRDRPETCPVHPAGFNRGCMRVYRRCS
jgi:hypothetical protein